MRRSGALAVAALLALSAAACRQPPLTVIPSSELPEDVYGSPPPSPSVEIPRQGTVYMVREERLVPITRPLQGTAGSLPEALMLALLQGPAGPPRGVRSAIPTDTRMNAIEVDDRTAVVDLSEDFERRDAERPLILRLAQVVYTLTEDPEVVSVRFSIDGVPTAVLAGNEQVQSRPVTRGDYLRFRPVEPEPEAEAEAEA